MDNLKPEKTVNISWHHHWFLGDGNDIWGTTAENPYWWRITTQVCVILTNDGPMRLLLITNVSIKSHNMYFIG